MRRIVLNVPLGFPDTALCGALNALGYSAAASAVSLYQIDIDVRGEPRPVAKPAPNELERIACKLAAINDLMDGLASDLTEASR